MANATFIKPETYKHLTESQIFEWRKLTYNNLGHQCQFTNTQMMSLDSYDLPSQEDLMTEISEQIKQAKILGNLNKLKDNIIYIDSSTICKLTIPTILVKLFKKYPERKDLNNILISSFVKNIFLLLIKLINFSICKFELVCCL